MASVKYEKANAMRSSQRKLIDLGKTFHLFILGAALLLFWYFSVFSVTVQAFWHVYGLFTEPDNPFYVFLLAIAIVPLIYLLSGNDDNDDEFPELPCHSESQFEITTQEAENNPEEFTPEKKMETLISPDKQFLHKHKSKVGESLAVSKETVPAVIETTTCYKNVTTNEVKVLEKNYRQREPLKVISPQREPLPPRRDDGSTTSSQRGGDSSVTEITTNEVKVPERNYNRRVQSNSYESSKVVSPRREPLPPRRGGGSLVTKTTTTPRRGGDSSINEITAIEVKVISPRREPPPPRRDGDSSFIETTTCCTNMTTNEVKVVQKNYYQRLQSDSTEQLPPRGGGSSVTETTTCCTNMSTNEVKVLEKNCYRRVQSKSYESLNVVPPRREPPPSRRGVDSSFTETTTCSTNMTTNEVKVSKKKCYRKVQSGGYEPVKVVAPSPELKRFNTGFHEQQHRRMCPVEHLNEDELNDAFADFIAKQRRLLWEEKMQETEYLALPR